MGSMITPAIEISGPGESESQAKLIQKRQGTLGKYQAGDLEFN